MMKVRVGEAAAIAHGAMRVFELDGTKVNVAHTGDAFYAFEDTCTHMGCSLANGELDGIVVTCACHGSQFDVTSGAVLRGPAQRPVRHISVTDENGQLLAEVPGPDR
jgi:3-phenylpropionate/trans-cinnamate dioxygenase ferredoxin subunit